MQDLDLRFASAEPKLPHKEYFQLFGDVVFLHQQTRDCVAVYDINVTTICWTHEYTIRIVLKIQHLTDSPGSR